MAQPWIYLKSGGDSELARYDIIASEPVEVFRGRNAWDALDEKIRRLPPTPSSEIPFANGYIGYISYEGEMWLMRPGKVEITAGAGSGDIDCKAAGPVARFSNALGSPKGARGLRTVKTANQPALGTFRAPPAVLQWHSHISKKEYIRRVQTILHHIREGDIYQANFAQTFSAPFIGDSFAFWIELAQKNPAAFFAYIDDGERQILCTSPELLMRQRGTHVESRPIKGTRPRGKTSEEDACLREELLASPKEAAELSMIVDLVRNDLHQSCSTGSVRVDVHRMIEAYTNVFHQVSVITGRIPSPQTNIRVLQYLFPGGSITGCPKRRAMEIIREMEGAPRGIYTGSIGYASSHGTQDWSIAIRTAVVQNGRIYLAVGGGIVADSDPEKEYEETLHKAASFFNYSPRSIT